MSTDPTTCVRTTCFPISDNNGVTALGFDRTITLVLSCPPYLIAGVLSVAWAWSSGKYNERTWHITISKLVALIGFVLACATLNTGARYFAMVVFTVGKSCDSDSIMNGN